MAIWAEKFTPFSGILIDEMSFGTPLWKSLLDLEKRLRCPVDRTITETAMAEVFARGQRRMCSAIRGAIAYGTLVEYLPSRRPQYHRPTDCWTSSMRYVGPPRFFRLMRMLAGSRGTNLTLQIL